MNKCYLYIDGVDKGDDLDVRTQIHGEGLQVVIMLAEAILKASLKFPGGHKPLIELLSGLVEDKLNEGGN